jgi:hypothetical protein
MTDIHDNDDNTPSKGHERIDFDLNPEYDKYGIEPLDDGTVILRVDENKHLFETVGVIRQKQTEVVLKKYIDSEGLEDEGSFETVESVSVRRNDFESRLQESLRVDIRGKSRRRASEIPCRRPRRIS